MELGQYNAPCPAICTGKARRRRAEIQCGGGGLVFRLVGDSRVVHHIGGGRKVTGRFKQGDGGISFWGEADPA
ncbi:MAG: hypothetical protein AAFY56_11325, partial [Pseudomonadota bacterium]